jgi:NAD(P)-dependent dehydrogenase (short-subunit alcohol dehydrogenase family)
MMSKKALIFGITSEIGEGVASLLRKDEWEVSGTSTKVTASNIFRLDLSSQSDVSNYLNNPSFFENWNLACFFAGTMQPIGPFFSVNFDAWASALETNAISQMRILQGIWKYRSAETIPTVCFLAGGGTNSSFDNYSAYCISKIVLIKFVELLASENPNSKFFIIGPGFIRTKIHQETLEAGGKAGKNLERTLNFMKSPGTSITDLYSHILWCLDADVSEVSGRNFSTVHDPWKSGDFLLSRLRNDDDLFKLRRKNLDVPD